MSFSLFKNPFEKMSAENQTAQAEAATKLSEYFTDDSKNTLLTGINLISKKMDSVVKSLADISKNLKVLGGIKTGKVNKKELEAVSASASGMGKGMLIIIEAMEAFTKLPKDAAENFILAIERIGEAFKKAEPVVKMFTKIGSVLMELAYGLIIFGLALILAAPIYALAAVASLIVMPVIFGWLYFFKKVLSDYPAENVIATGESLMMMAAGIVLFGLALLVAGVIYSQLSMGGVLLIMAVILGISFIFAEVLGSDGFGKKMKDGAEGLMYMAGAILLFGLALLLAIPLYNYIFGQQDSGTGAMIILGVIGVVIALMFILDGLSGTIKDGVKSLLMMAGVILIFGIALLLAIPLYNYIFSQPDAGEGMLLIGAVILGAVGVFFLLSKIEGDIMKGAIGMAIMAGVILLLGVAIWAFGKLVEQLESPWEDLALLGVTIGGLAIIMSLIGADSVMIELGAAAMVASAVPLLMIAGAMWLWKQADIGWEDLAMAGAAVAGLGVEMAIAGAASLFIGLGAIAMIAAGGALILLSTGLKSFKEIDFTEKDSDNLKSVLGNVVDAFDINPIKLLKASFGTVALAGLGGVMSSLAKGVQDFANMTFTTYEVKDGKIIPKSVVKLSDADIEGAAINFGKVLDAMLVPLGRVGAAEAATEGWFSGGFITKGISALTGVGAIFSGLAKGVQDFANLTFTTWEVKDGKIVPKEIIKLSDADIAGAAINFGKVLDTMLIPLGNVGKAEADSSGWFSGGFISKGITALTGVGSVMAGLSKGVQDFANMTFTTYEVKDGKLVPKEVVKLKPADIALAKANLDLVLGSVMLSVIDIGKLADTFEDEIEAAMDVLPIIGDNISKFVKITKDMGELKPGASVSTLLSSIFATIGIISRLVPPAAMGSFMNLTNHFVLLGNSAKGIVSVADSMERIAKAMGTFKDNVNGMDKTNLKDSKALFEAMAIISKSGSAESLMKKYGDSMKETFKQLAELLSGHSAQVTGAVTASTASNQNAISAISNYVAPSVASAPAARTAAVAVQAPVTPTEPPIDMAPLLTVMTSIESLLRSGIKVKQAQF